MSRSRCRDGAEGGFTLIEVVVALAVVAASLAAIGSLIVTAQTGARTLEQKVKLVETARLIVTELALGGEPGAPNSGSDLAGHRWRARAFPFVGDEAVVPDSPWIPQRIVVDVQSSAGVTLSLETVRLQRRAAP